MNIFVLDEDPVKAAMMICDKHLTKMPLESTQLWSTHIKDCGFDIGYAATHRGHPCSIWMKLSKGNFDWMAAYTLALFDEFNYRRGKDHSSRKVYLDIIYTLMDYPYIVPSDLEIKPGDLSFDWLQGLARKDIIELIPTTKGKVLIKFKHIKEQTDFYPAMDTQYRVGSNVVEMYHNYYRTAKKDIVSWNTHPERGNWYYGK